MFCSKRFASRTSFPLSLSHARTGSFRKMEKFCLRTCHSYALAIPQLFLCACWKDGLCLLDTVDLKASRIAVLACPLRTFLSAMIWTDPLLLPLLTFARTSHHLSLMPKSYRSLLVMLIWMSLKGPVRACCLRMCPAMHDACQSKQVPCLSLSLQLRPQRDSSDLE